MARGFFLKLGLILAGFAVGPILALAAAVIEPPINVQINAPTNLRRVEISWEASPSEGVLYRIYRSQSSSAVGGLIADKLVVKNYVDAAVEYGVTYYYRLASVLDGAVSALTAPLPISANLAPPENVMAADTTQGGEIKLTWRRPTEGLVLTYNIYRSSKEPELGGRVAREAVGVEYYDKNLENNTRYYYRLKSVDTSGREGYGSAPIMGIASDSKPPAPPVISGNFENPDRAYVSWSVPPNERGLSYVVYRSQSPGLQGDRIIQTNDTRYRQYNLPLGVTYYYGVTATDGAGNVSELSKQVKIAIGNPSQVAATPKVSNLTAEGTIKAGEILLRWKQPSDNRVVYGRIYRRASESGEAGQIADRVPGSSYLDKIANPGQRYYYFVRLVGKDGTEYQPSEQVSATAFDPANRSQGFTPTGPTIIRPATPANTVSAPAPVAYAYGKPRLANLALETALTNNLRRALIKKFGVKAAPRRINPVLVKAYLYGGYTIDEIADTIQNGPSLVHPNIRAVEWRGSRDYQRRR